MANPTEDPRIEELETPTIYGLYHLDNLIYVGATRQTLQRRLTQHGCAARDGQDLAVCEYIYEQVGNDRGRFRDEFSIEGLDYETEQEALEALATQTLNEEEKGRGLDEERLDLSAEQLDVIEEHTLTEATERLDDLGYESVRSIAKRLGCLEADKSTHLSAETVRAIWTRYHALEDATYESVTAHFDVSEAVVGGIIRREHYTDVDLPSKTAINAHHALTQD